MGQRQAMAADRFRGRPATTADGDVHRRRHFGSMANAFVRSRRMPPSDPPRAARRVKQPLAEFIDMAAACAWSHHDSGAMSHRVSLGNPSGRVRSDRLRATGSHRSAGPRCPRTSGHSAMFDKTRMSYRTRHPAYGEWTPCWWERSALDLLK